MLPLLNGDFRRNINNEITSFVSYAIFLVWDSIISIEQISKTFCLADYIARGN